MITAETLEVSFCCVDVTAKLHDEGKVNISHVWMITVKVLVRGFSEVRMILAETFEERAKLSFFLCVVFVLYDAAWWLFYVC